MVDSRNKLNDLTTTEWVARTVSVATQRGLGKDSKEAKYEKQHPAPFSFQDVARFIEFFTKAGNTVLDPFAGVASTLKASALLGRKSVGFELNKSFCLLAKKRLQEEVGKSLLSKNSAEIRQGDVKELAGTLRANSVHFVITSPPYWGILDKIDHKVNQERITKGLRHNYGNHSKDFAAIESYGDFVSELTTVFAMLSDRLIKNRYAVVIVGDFRDKGSYHMFHADLANSMERDTPFILKGITILYQKFKRVFPYGYPYAYVPNLHHQYAMIFRNEK